MKPSITSFEQFWPYYVGEHKDPLNRFLHYVGTACGVLAGVVGVLSLSPGFVAVAPILGYGPAWIGHGLIEHNRPATWDFPSWSLRADFRMLGLALRGRMTDEVVRVCGVRVPMQRETHR